jgi:NADPH:quinone reductase-like Zn-dependent oxidoreductase
MAGLDSPPRRIRASVTPRPGDGIIGQGSALRFGVKAARIHEYGGPDVIRYEDVEKPTAGEGEVLLKVAAAGFNPADRGDRAGGYRKMPLPFTLGYDVAGTVEEVADPAAGIAVGDRVIGRLDHGGPSAEYAVAPADVLVLAPESIPLADAAAIPVAGLTAWQAVHEHGHLASGQRVLVNGAGGGVGGFAVQLAKQAGAHVIATASPRSADAVRARGADEVIDYTTTSVTDAVGPPVDAVLSLVFVGREAGESLASLVRPGGVIVSITGKIEVPADLGITSTGFGARNDPGILAELVRLVDAGDLTVDVAERLPLSKLADVHRRSEAGEIRGKVILIP